MSRIRAKIAFSLIVISITSIKYVFATCTEYSTAKIKFFPIKKFPEFTRKIELAWF